MTKITVGLDVGDRFSQVCAVDVEGVLINEGRVATTREALRDRLPAQPRCRVILETGPHAGWISRELSAVGHEVLVANGRKLRWLSANEHKTDRVDARYRARVGRWDPTLLAPIRVRSARADGALRLLRARASLVAFACQPADTTASAKQAIDAANAQWPRLTSTGHADSIAEFYAADAVLMPPNMATITGKDAVRAFFATINTIDPRPTLTLRAETVVASGPVAVETGRWHWAFPAGATLPPGTPAVDSGKYIVRWAEQNGRWLMVDDVWNSDLPLPTAPPPPLTLAPRRSR